MYLSLFRPVSHMCGVACGMLLLTGCITSYSSMQEVAITTSNGQSVIAHIDGKRVKIPARVKVSRSKGAVIMVRAEDNPGYKTTQLIINGSNKVASLFWLNILFPGVWATDTSSSSSQNYTHPSFSIPLTRKERSSR